MQGSHSRLIAAAAILAIACDSPPRAGARADSSGVPSRTEAGPGPAGALGTFAFVDSTGTQLLALDSLSTPSTIIGAICSGATTLRVRHDRKQLPTADDNGRQLASNFHNQRGEVFRVASGTAPDDKTCYLSPDSALVSAARAAVMREPSSCPPSEASRVGNAKGRKVLHCWEIASAPSDVRLLAVQFATIDTSALASLVIVRDTSMAFKDFPATYRGADESTWRVDDEGIFSPLGFDILFVAPMSYGYVVAFTWAGAEGETSELLLSESVSTVRTVAQAYRYWSPT